MNLIITDILPNNITISPTAQHDIVKLEWHEANRRILRKTSEQGKDIAFRLLQEGQRLTHGAVVYASEDVCISIHIKRCNVIVMSPETMPEMARACYEIGNKHSPLFLDGDELIMPYDKPMFLWLQAAGFCPKQDRRRLTHVLRANSAPGMSSHTHHHSHGHEHSHSHGHHHDH